MTRQERIRGKEYFCFKSLLFAQGKEEVRCMICPACGAHLDDDSKFCEVCGSRIDLSNLTPSAVSEMSEATEGGKAPTAEKPETAEAEKASAAIKPYAAEAGKVSAAIKPYAADAEKASAAEKPSMAEREKVSAVEKPAGTAASAAKEVISAHPAPKTGRGKGTGDAASSPGKPADRRLKIIGLSVGTVIMIIGFIRIATAGTSISSTSFGADFYTYTYQGIVAVTEALAAIEVTLGWILVAIGAAIDVLSLRS